MLCHRTNSQALCSPGPDDVHHYLQLQGMGRGRHPWGESRLNTLYNPLCLTVCHQEPGPELTPWPRLPSRQVGKTELAGARLAWSYLQLTCIYLI